MLFPVAQLTKGRSKPLCVEKTESIKKAMRLMIEHDYSQLPVITEDGILCGLVSENSILTTDYHCGGYISLLDLSVEQCLAPAISLTEDRDIFEAIERLKSHYAIVIVDDQKKPTGILTNYDAATFFYEFSEGLILVADIEINLRHYVEIVFPTHEQLKVAWSNAFGEGQIPNDESVMEIIDNFTFYELIRLITAPKNWGEFEGVFEPKRFFSRYMEGVRDIRNKLAHFRGNIEPIERNFLIKARNWLAARRRLPLMGKDAVPVKNIPEPIVKSLLKGNKYDRLAEFLRLQKNHPIRLDLDQVAQLVDGLPPSAYTHRAWWANDSVGHVQSKAWLGVGWRVSNANLEEGYVVFVKMAE